MDSKDYIALQRLPFQQRLDAVYQFMARERSQGNLMGRMGDAPADTLMRYQDPASGDFSEMLIFGSNNYLGFANDPEILESVINQIRKFGIGTGGSPAFSGYTSTHANLERRLAALSGHPAGILLPGGYMANLCWINGLMTNRDILLYDKYSHASVMNAMKMAGVRAYPFDPDKPETLEKLINLQLGKIETEQHLFITVEGVRSIDGTVTELEALLEIAEHHKDRITFMLDDAHGLGSVGERGHGTLEYLGLKGKVDLRMSTCSKAFGAQGAFLTGSEELINYMRVSAKPYVFTTALAQPLVAAISAALDFLETHPERVKQLHDNAAYMQNRMEQAGFRIIRGPGGIVPVFIPNVSTTQFNRRLHEQHLFANVMEYPMVPPGMERVRLSIMATHTREDLDRAADILIETGREFEVI